MKNIYSSFLANAVLFSILLLLSSAGFAKPAGGSADFSLPPGPHCQFGPNVLPSNVTSPGQGYFYELSGNVIFVDSITGEIDMQSSNVGTWQVSRNVFGSIATRTLVILSGADAAFSYPSDTLCLPATSMLTPVITGAGMGIFSSSGLAIDSISGIVDLNGVSAGTYVVNYSTNGQCPDSRNDTLYGINSANAYFAYQGNIFCAVDSLVLDSLAPNGSGGVWTASPVSAVLNPTNGTILLGSTAQGIYVITHEISGQCGAIDSTQIEIVAPIPGPLFDYGDTVHCKADPIFAPISFFPGIIFSGPLNAIDSLTGLVDPTLLSSGLNLITAETGSVCGETLSQQILILDSTQVTLTASGDTLFSPGPGTGHQWYMNGTPVVGATDSSYFAAVSGSYEVRYARVGDSCGTIGTLSYVGISESIQSIVDFQVYPNPGNGNFRVALQVQKPLLLDWRILNLLGQVQQSGSFGKASGRTDLALDLSAIAPGSYLLQVISNEGTMTKKLVLIR